MLNSTGEGNLPWPGVWDNCRILEDFRGKRKVVTCEGPDQNNEGGLLYTWEARKAMFYSTAYQKAKPRAVKLTGNSNSQVLSLHKNDYRW